MRYDFRQGVYGFFGVVYGTSFCNGSQLVSPGSFVTLVVKAKNYDWDRLIWILYDRQYRDLEAWEWTVGDYRLAFERVDWLSPAHLRKGRCLHCA